jgi:hypothetical protein
MRWLWRYASIDRIIMIVHPVASVTTPLRKTPPARPSAAEAAAPVATCQVCNGRGGVDQPQRRGGNDQQAAAAAPYRCPKCAMPYCSVECYKHHKTDCTESFFHGRVAQVLQLEVKERKNDMRRVLQRFHDTQRNNSDSMDDPSQFLLHGNDQEDEKPDGCYSNSDKKHKQRQLTVPPFLSTEQLRQLWESLENCETEQDWDRLWRESPMLMRSALAQLDYDQRYGDARLEEWCLEPWHPWWQPRLEEEPVGEVDDEALPSATGASTTTLDEDCILNTPAFQAISNRRDPHPSVPYNLVDLLYGIIVTLRLYHGVNNSADVPNEAIATLLDYSMVLRQSDCGFESVSAVLLHLSTTMNNTTKLSNTCKVQHDNDNDRTGMGKAPPAAATLTGLDDVAVILANRRYVARALWEGQTILQRRKRTQRLAKKIEYYRSWALSHRPVVQSLAEQVEGCLWQWRQQEQPEA